MLARHQPPQRGYIQVIIMIVAEHHGVDGRQVFEGYSWLSPPARTCPRHWAGPLRPNRVRQNAATRLLKQDRRMIDESGSQLTAFNAARRHGLLDIRNKIRRRFRPSGQLPPDDLKQAGSLWSIRVEKALPIKVFRKFTPRFSHLSPNYSSSRVKSRDRVA